MINQWLAFGAAWAMSGIRNNCMAYKDPPYFAGKKRALPIPSWGPLVTIALVTWAMTGCHRPSPATSGQETSRAEANEDNLPDNPSDGVRTSSEVERGPVKVQMRATPGHLRLSDEVELVLRIEQSRTARVTTPPFTEDLGPFIVRDFHEQPLTQQADRLVLEQHYRLEPIETGELTIDAIPVHFTDNRPDGDQRGHTISTDPLVIKVQSAVDDTDVSLANIKPLSKPIAADSLRRWRWIGIFAIIPVATALIGLAWWWLHRVRAAFAAILSPREIAMLGLAQLQRDEPADRDIKMFFKTLTGIVREYIEAVTTVRAPELTTGEFFQAITNHPAFSTDAVARLRAFLEAADLVKFAAHRPTNDEIANSLETARVFINTIGGDEGSRT